jgi:DeoR/GlpR family transcriptional regulator of sugar metabolism
MKRAMAERCQQVIGLIDARKWGKVAASTFAHLDQIHKIVSDTAAPADLVEQVRQHGIEVILV